MARTDIPFGAAVNPSATRSDPGRGACDRAPALSTEARARIIPSYLTDTPLCRDCGRADHEVAGCRDAHCPFRKAA